MFLSTLCLLRSVSSVTYWRVVDIGYLSFTRVLHYICWKDKKGSLLYAVLSPLNFLIIYYLSVIFYIPYIFLDKCLPSHVLLRRLRPILVALYIYWRISAVYTGYCVFLGGCFTLHMEFTRRICWPCEVLRACLTDGRLNALCTEAMRKQNFIKK
jgi:hypothetical protein